MHVSASLAIAVALYVYAGILHWDLLRAHDRLLGHFDDIERAETEGCPDLGERIAFMLVKGAFVIGWPLFLAASTVLALADLSQ
jgi:hypothetical protein